MELTGFEPVAPRCERSITSYRRLAFARVACSQPLLGLSDAGHFGSFSVLGGRDVVAADSLSGQAAEYRAPPSTGR